MYFEHAPPIWETFPTLVPGVLYVEGILPVGDTAAQVMHYLDRARTRLAGSAEAELPEVQAWRRAFSRMGLKPTQYRSAAEALLRRFRKEDTLPTLHPLVDLCNAISLAYALPVAVIDLDRVVGGLQVRHAEGNEISQAFNGETEHPEQGEVIFADDARHAHARRWTFRQSRHSTVSVTTRRALVVSEGLHDTAGADIAALMATLETEFQTSGLTTANRAILTANAPRWEAIMPPK